HLFILFDSGIPPGHALALGVPPSLYVVDDDRVWIPLETTQLPLGFAAAWQLGAERFWREQPRGDLKVIDVERAGATYRPSPPRGLAGSAPSLDPSVVRSAMEKDRATLASWRLAYEDTALGGYADSSRRDLGDALRIARLS